MQVKLLLITFLAIWCTTTLAFTIRTITRTSMRLYVYNANPTYNGNFFDKQRTEKEKTKVRNFQNNLGLDIEVCMR